MSAPSALFVTTVPVTLEAFLLPFADHLRGQGWRVDALANGAALDPRLEGHFDERFDVEWSRDPLAVKNLAGPVRRVRELVSARTYDIVHVHTPIAGFVTRLALRRAKAENHTPAVIYTAHGFHFYQGQRPAPHALFRTLERVAARWTDYLVTVNREDWTAAGGFRGIEPDRVRLIPGIGVDTTRYSPSAVSPAEVGRIRQELGAGDGRFLLTMVAELSPVKRHELALKALSLAKHDRVVLALVGDGPLDARTRETATRLGLGDRVRFAGYRRDVPAVLTASDALLLTSEREGLNRSVLEAMASGRPIIGTDTRGITDAVGDSAGWIVGHDDAEALAAAIDHAASHPSEVARLGAAARERACAEFALDRIVNAYDLLYAEALAHHV